MRQLVAGSARVAVSYDAAVSVLSSVGLLSSCRDTPSDISLGGQLSHGTLLNCEGACGIELEGKHCLSSYPSERLCMGLLLKPRPPLGGWRYLWFSAELSAGCSFPFSHPISWREMSASADCRRLPFGGVMSRSNVLGALWPVKLGLPRKHKTAGCQAG